MAGTSNYTAILAAVVARLDAITGTGVIHARTRLTHDWTTFIANFVTAGNVLGWTVSRRATSERHLTSLENEREYIFRLRGYMQINDAAATETTFQEMIEDVCDDFRETYTLDATAELAEPPQVLTVEERAFASVLCHYCEIEIRCIERIAGG